MTAPGAPNQVHRTIALGAALLAAACNGETTIEEAVPLRENTSGKGLVEAKSQHTPAEATEALRQAVRDAALLIPVDLSHSDAATAAQLSLAPSHLLMFGDPAWSTPFMRENALVALDLPPKMLVFEAPNGDTHVAYDAPGYLRTRHDLATMDAGLQVAADAIADLASVATGTTVTSSAGDVSRLSPGEGLVTHTSAQDAPSTLAALESAIEANADLRVLALIDHQAAADSAGLELGFTTVIVFGNAAVGTPLMQSAPTVGLDLPLKMLVAEVSDEVLVAYSSPDFLVSRHVGLYRQPQLEAIGALFESLASSATQN